MSDQSGTNIPWAGIAVIVALVSSTYLVPHAFQQLRPPEKERAQPPPEVDLEVDARLWEDPFFALRRFETERADRCGKQAAAEKKNDPNCESAEQLKVRRGAKRFMDGLKDKNHDGLFDEVLIIAALVPGNPFVGAEESRRRTRYATLAGLQAKGYVPENAERIGLLQFDIADPADLDRPRPAAAGASNVQASGERNLIVPFEVLTERPLLRVDSVRPSRRERYSQIVLLWIDEAALPQAKLTALARIFGNLLPIHHCKLPHLVIIGPSSSDNLRAGLADLNRAAKTEYLVPPREGDHAQREKHCGVTTEAAPPPPPASSVAPVATSQAPLSARAKAAQEARNGYWLMSRADLLDALATAADHQLEELNGQPIDKFLNQRFGQLADPQGSDVDVHFKRMIATDADVLAQLVRELELRLPGEANRRVVLVAERDSLYAQALVRELKQGLKKQTSIRFEQVYFYRGLDGVTTREGAEKSGGGAQNSATAKGSDSASAIEWPESRDQLDYLRRMAASLKASDGASRGGRIGAIGILANDVHDKLLVLQALHDTFPDKVFFTTDMDARYLHPATLAFTRNLVVGTSLPLEFTRVPVLAQGAAAGGGAKAKPGLQAGTPPLRDVYQSASYLAARRAACRDPACRDEEDAATKEALDNPSIYEIGRNSAVPLAGYAFTTRPAESNASRVVLALVLTTVFAGALLVWPSSPSIRRARAMVLPTLAPGDGDEHIDLLTAALVALHVGLLSFAVGSLIEFASPGHLGLVDILLLTALTSAGVLLGLYSQDPDRGLRVTRAARRGFPLVIAVLIGLTWAWTLWRVTGKASCLDCEPVAWLEGVSAWPSHLVHLLALMVIAWGLDATWATTRKAMKDDSVWLRVPVDDGNLDGRSLAPQGAASRFAAISIAAWRGATHPAVDGFNKLWLQYVGRGTTAARVTRTAMWYVGTVGLMLALFITFSDGQVPEVPVRGDQHRNLVAWALYATLLLLPLLVVAVADATMLLSRFVWHLNRARTSYSDDTVAAFASGFGPAHFAEWTARLAADPRQRDAEPPDVAARRNTLLDDWIDVQVVARRSQAVAPLVMWPFVVLALLVVARSRLFDNWSVTLPVAVGAAAYLLWMIVLALILKFGAERTRTVALGRMNADLRWLSGLADDDPRKKLVEPFKDLIAEVRANQTGAFAKTFDQPLFRAILVPLGGVGGAQLFDHLLLGR